jgi:predicted MFS family arabinose efflux permease
MYGVSIGPLHSWSSPTAFASCIAGAVLLTAMVFVELRSSKPMVDLRLLSGRLFRSTNAVMFLVAAAFLGTLYLIPLYFQDARGLSALQSGLSTFPEAFGVMAGAQLASRLIYPRVGPRRHVTFGLLALTVMLLLLTQIGVSTNLWLIRGLMFALGLAMAQVMVPNQAASFAMISPADTGRASTFFNTMRQVGSAVGVAILSTVLIAVGSTEGAGGSTHANMRAYHLAFATAALFAIAATVFSLTIHDSDAAETMVRRGRSASRTGTSPASVRESVV